MGRACVGLAAKRDQDRVFPDPAGFQIASRTLKVSNLWGRFLEPAQNSAKVTVGIWRPDTKEWVSPPQTSKLMVDGCDFFLDDSFIFTVTKTPELPDCVLMIELYDKRLLRKHEVGEGTVPMRLLMDFFDQDQNVISERNKVLNSESPLMPVSGTLVKPDGQKNTTNRGSWKAKVDLTPLTYEVDPTVFFKHLPHTIKYWIVLLRTQTDYNPLPQAGIVVKNGKKDEVPKISNVDRFRSIAAELMKLPGKRFVFAEGEMSMMDQVRKGTRVALNIQQMSNLQVVFGQVVAMQGNQHLTFGASEMYDHRLGTFLAQFNPTSGLWSGAADVLKQLSPSAMADPDWDGDDDTVDFSSMASLGTLFRQTGDALGSSSRERRVDALTELATRAPQALCSLALHVPFDVMVRELEGVIYDAEEEASPRRMTESTRFQKPSPASSPTPSVNIATPGKQASSGLRRTASDGKSSVFGTFGTSPNSSGKTGAEKQHSASAMDLESLSISSPNSSLKESPSTSNMKQAALSAFARAGQFMSMSKKPIRTESGMKSGDTSPLAVAPAIQHDRTWHGTQLTPNQIASGQYMVSDVPRHGALRPGGGQAPTSLRPLPGRLGVLQRLAAVLGREFIEKYVMPCLRHADADREELAGQVGQLYYSASLAGSAAAEELMEIHSRLLQSGSTQQRLNAVHSIEVIARYDDEETAVYVQECILELRPLLVEEDGESAAAGVDADGIARLRDALVFITPLLFRCPEEHSSASPVESIQASVSAATRAARTIQGMRVEHVREVTLSAMAEIMGAAIERPTASPTSPDPRHSRSSFERPLHEPFVAPIVHQHNAAGGKRSREERFVEAGLALMRVAGPDSWRLISAAWTPMLHNPSFHSALAGALPHLCKLLTEDHAAPAPPDSQEFLRACLVTCVQLKDVVPMEDTGDGVLLEESADAVLWLMKTQAEKPHLAKLLGQLPIVLTAIDETWPERIRWVRVMTAVYTAYLAEQRLKLPGAVWTVGQDGSVDIGGHTFSENDFPISDSLALAYQLPAAVRICRQEQFMWSKALVVHRSMGADTSMDVRWMISHSIHLFPALFEPDCVPILCNTFESLLRDLDLDVAEGAHKNYLGFVIAVAASHPARGVQLARSFLDAGLWDRRLHFASFQAEQLPAYVQCGLVEGADVESVDAIKRLLQHPCTTVRRCAAASAAQLLAWSNAHQASGGIGSNLALVQGLIALSEGTVRERQTLVWACMGLAVLDPKFVQRIMRPALERIATAELSENPARSLVKEDVTTLLRVLSGGDAGSFARDGDRRGEGMREQLAIPLSALLRGGTGSPTRRLSIESGLSGLSGTGSAGHRSGSHSSRASEVQQDYSPQQSFIDGNGDSYSPGAGRYFQDNENGRDSPSSRPTSATILGVRGFQPGLIPLDKDRAR